jgi:hypothetical protein
VRRDVVGVHLRTRCVYRIDPCRIGGTGVDDISVLVDPIVVVGHGDEVSVVTVVTSAVLGDDVEDCGAVQEILDVSAKYIEVSVLVHHRASSLVTKSWSSLENLTVYTVNAQLNRHPVAGHHFFAEATPLCRRPKADMDSEQLLDGIIIGVSSYRR